MNEYWEITHTRGVATLAVWYLQPAYELLNCNFGEHQTRVAAMPTVAQDRADRETELTDARAAAERLYAKVLNLNVRVPGVIDGQLTPDDDLHGQLDHVFAIVAADSRNNALRRARLVAGLWTDFNSKLAGQTPPRPALTLAYVAAGSEDPPVTVALADFQALILACVAAETAEAEAQREVSKKKTELRSLDKRVDRDNKRWYLAWTKTYPEGTEEGDAARSQVPTEQGTPPPEPLEIATLTVQGDRTVTVAYPVNGGKHATTLELLWKLAADVDYGHSVPVARPSQTSGPFASGAVVTFVTRVANSTAGVVMGTPKTVVIP